MYMITLERLSDDTFKPFIGLSASMPQIGNRFVACNPSGKTIITTYVTKILEEGDNYMKFHTKNSIYRVTRTDLPENLTKIEYIP